MSTPLYRDSAARARAEMLRHHSQLQSAPAREDKSEHVTRLDRSRLSLGKFEKTPTGGFLVPAVIARVCVLEYGDGKGGIVREYNPPEVLQAALDSLRNAPVTVDHPAEPVGTNNYKQHAAGFVSSGVEFKDGMIRAVLALQEQDLIADVENGFRREISAGYSANLRHTPGTTPAGEKYDAIRTSITFNHVAVVTAGRAGPDVRLVLDGRERPLSPREEMLARHRELSSR